MQACIYQRTKSTMQSGQARTDKWVLEYEPETRRYPEPLMGWTASGDTLNQVVLSFKTVDEAKAFAEKNGWAYSVTPPQTRHVQPRNYIDNFRDKTHLLRKSEAEGA